MSLSIGADTYEMDYNYMTKEGLEKLMEEITRLESQERPKIAQMIAEARDKGDLFISLQPDTPETTIFQTLIDRTLNSPAALAILPLQDWLSADPHYLEVTDYRQEQINYPEDQEHSWLYRLPFAL